MENYIRVRLEDNIPDEALLVYDADTDTLRNSGLTAKDGDIQAAAGTVKVGLQDMSSAGEQVTWRNNNSGIVYSPPWHIIDETNPGGSRDRFYGEMQVIPRQTIKSGVLEDPSFQIEVFNNVVVHRVEIEAQEAHPNMVINITQNGMDVWRKITAISQGVNVISLKVPVALYTGFYDVELVDNDTGTPVRLLGDPQTGVIAYTEYLRDFEEKPLATEEFVQEALGDTNSAFTASFVKLSPTSLHSSAPNVKEIMPLNVIYYYGQNDGDYESYNYSMWINSVGTYRFQVELVVKSTGPGSLTSWLEYSEDEGATWEPIRYSGVHTDIAHSNHETYMYPSYSVIKEISTPTRVRVMVSTSVSNGDISLFTHGQVGEAHNIPGGTLTGIKLTKLEG